MDAFAALGDPVRRGLLADLAAAPARVVDLAETRSISRPAVSKHLRLLAEAGLVSVESRGRERHYRLRRDGLAPLTTYVEGLIRTGPLTDNALDALETEVRRTSRERRRETGAIAPTTDAKETA
ncbi:ArsR/SmtB family transcription factor [Nocardioides soli]|uniref:DNA-binding transcriptional ArsR family regulator n=1 Tax=Nocardioides soli TaxID=1036020 RepID=A0A7W4VYU9_9ACTN|nr:metalloregulator ArsR/SmtB family transcription factor [Nocardioides soli]MBB3044250.1 DNA-binding transcriptional ArsR family regulator [Nocardioides soli]